MTSSDPAAVLAAVRARDYRRTTFTKRNRPALRAVAETIVTDDEALSAERLDAFVDDFDHFVSRSSKTLRFGVSLMLEIIRWMPILLLRRFSLFENLPYDERVALLEKMEQHRFFLISLIFVAFKAPMTVVWFENEESLRKLGYPGEARERYKKLLPVLAEK